MIQLNKQSPQPEGGMLMVSILCQIVSEEQGHYLHVKLIFDNATKHA